MSPAFSEPSLEVLYGPDDVHSIRAAWAWSFRAFGVQAKVRRTFHSTATIV